MTRMGIKVIVRDARAGKDPALDLRAVEGARESGMARGPVRGPWITPPLRPLTPGTCPANWKMF